MSELDAMLARLRGEAELADRGGFTLDGARAREQLRGAQLAEPRRWVVLLVRAAVMHGATRIAIRLERDGLRVDFDGPRLTRPELEGLWSGAFEGGDVSSTPALRELAVACNAALALPLQSLEIRSASAEGSSLLTVRPGEPDLLSSTRHVLAGTRVQLRERGGVLDRWLGPRASRPEAKALQEACAYATAEITLGGVRISQGLSSVRLQVDGPIAADVAGRCGFARVDAPPRVIVLQHEVLLTTRTPPSLPRGFVAIVDGSALRTDVSRSEPVEDDAWQRIVAALEQAARGHLLTLAQRSSAKHEPSAWLSSVFREQLAAHDGTHDAGDALMAALAELPLWTRVDGLRCSTRALAMQPQVRYAQDVTGQGLPDVADILTVDREQAAQLLKVFPDAVESALELSRAREREQLRRLAQLRAEQAEVATRSETPVVARTQLPARTRFLARPQLWSARLGPTVLGPIELVQGHVRCIVGVDAELGRGHAREHAHVRVMREQRVLTDLKLRCPIPSLVAIVIDDRVAANAAWNGLADDAELHRVLGVLASAMGALIRGALSEAEPRTAASRRVLAAVACAPFASAVWLRAWRSLQSHAPETATDELGALLELAARHGEPDVATLLRERLIAGEPPRVAAIAEALARAELPVASGSSRALDACTLEHLDALWRMPLIAGTHALADLAARPEQLGAQRLHRWEHELLRRLFGDAHPVLAAVVVAPTSVVQASSAFAAETTPTEPADADDEPAFADRPATSPAVAVHTPIADAPPVDAADPAPEPVELTLEQRLIATVLDALHRIRAHDPRVPFDARMERISLAPIIGPTLVETRDHDVVVNAGHPVVHALLDADAFDPFLVDFVVSGLYTAVNIALREIADDDERVFLSAHARLIASRPQA